MYNAINVLAYTMVAIVIYRETQLPAKFWLFSKHYLIKSS